MPLHLGSGEKVKVNKQGALIRFHVPTPKPITNGTRLLSSEDYILKDSKGTYLTTRKESGE